MNEHAQQSEWKIIKLGGSILVPEFADGEYLRAFREFVEERVAKGERFLIIVGGGNICRKYQRALVDTGVTENEAQDWIGIFSIHFNAELVRLAFGDMAYTSVINAPRDLPELIEDPIVICGAEEPGHSSNYDAVIFAQHVDAKTIINLSNIDYVYDSDPRENPDAVKYPEVSWEQYRTFIPDAWQSGLSTPFDPVASASAQELDLEVVFMKGRPIENLKHYFETGETQGTIISNRFA